MEHDGERDNSTKQLRLTKCEQIELEALRLRTAAKKTMPGDTTFPPILFDAAGEGMAVVGGHRDEDDYFKKSLDAIFYELRCM